MELGLTGKFALVTGGSHGIGESIALELSQEGCNVCICSRSCERLDRASAKIRENNVSCLSIQCDVHNVSDIDKVLKTILSEWGSVHILVNNVGGGGRWGKTILDTPELTWNEVYEKNMMATLRFTKGVLPKMIEQKWGRVVTITSIYGKEAGGRPWFNVAKSAQTTLMKNFSRQSDLIRSGITFNSVAPGGIMIPDTGWDVECQSDPVGFAKKIQQEYPLGRLGVPKEVSAVVAFLCSERASLVNGASVAVDGGESHYF